MSNTINPYSASRAHVQQRPEPAPEPEEESLSGESTRPDKVSKSNNHTGPIEANKNDSLEDAEKLAHLQEPDEAIAGKFISTLEGAIERKDDVSLTAENKTASSSLPGLSIDEQKMIYRYFPEVPNLEMRLYKPDMSTNKVDPGSVGSRVDLRG